MSQNKTIIRTSFLLTKDKLPDRILFAGKTEPSSNSENFFFYIVEILSPWFPQTKLKKVILDILDKAEFPNDYTQAESFFEQTIGKINQGLESLAQNGENDWIGNVNAAIGFICLDTLYLTQVGTITGYIFRKSKISSITNKASSEPQTSNLETFTDITSGKIIPEDRIIFGNAEFYNHISLDRLRRLVEKSNIGTAAQELLRIFRHLKAFSVNSVLVEMRKKEEVENEILANSPEFLYVDSLPEKPIELIKKKIKTLIEATSPELKRLVSLGINNYNRYKNQTRKAAAPLIEKMMKAGSKKVSGALDKVETSAPTPVGHVIKKFNKNQKGQKFWLELSKLASKFVRVLTIVLDRAIKLLRQGHYLLLPRNRKYLYVIIAVIVIFFGFLKIKTNSQKNNIGKPEIAIVNYYDQASSLFSQAKMNLDLGKEGSAKQLLEARALAEKASNDNTKKTKSETLIKEINQTLDSTTKTVRAESNKSILSFNSTVVGIVSIGSEIFSIDNEGKIYSADTRDKEAHLVASIGKEYGQASKILYAESLNKILISTSKNKLIAFDPLSKTHNELVVSEAEGEWENALSFVNYSSNLYLLDGTNKTVSKHTLREDGYSKGSRYLNDKNQALTNPVDLTVDGDIYILQGDGTLLKFAKGSLDPTFRLGPVPVPFDKIEQPKQVYTDADSTEIYLLDQKENRILVFNKTGNFLNQYIVDGKTLANFTVNTKLKKLWLLSRGQVFEIDL